MKKWIYRIALAGALAVFAFSAYQLYKIYEGSKQVDDERDRLAELAQEEEGFVPDWTALKAQNPDIVAWVYVPGCDNISFPVVQGDDNDYYLDHTVMKEYNIRGAIFLDHEAAPDLSNENSIVYGHSVDQGGMFTSLDRFEDPSFFEQHPYFYVMTPSQNYKCPILAFGKTTEGSPFYMNYENHDTAAHAAEIEKAAMYYRAQDVSNKNLVTLSTCDLDYGFDSMNRLTLVGILEPTDERIVIE